MQEATRSINTEADAAVEVMCKQLNTGLTHRQPRFDQIQRNEQMYQGHNPPALKGRSNIPFDSVVMRGFIDTLLAGIDEPIDIKYERTREQDKRAAEKITSVWQKEAAPQKGAWDDKIMDSKKLATFAGRGFLKLIMTSSPKFESDLEVCDHMDMVTEPQGGANLDKHLFKFQMNIFRSKEELITGAQAGFYRKYQVAQLVARANDHEYFKISEDAFKNKNSRYQAFGIDVEMNSYVGSPMFRLTEGVSFYKGKWYYSVFSYELKTWIRFEPLEDVFTWAKEYPGRGPWTSYSTSRHPFLFWNTAPADDIRPIAYTMKKVVNYTVDNLEKRNWDMKAYDPKMFPDPSQFNYKPDGLVRANLKPGQAIGTGLYSFTTPDTVGVSINVIQWLNSFLGTKTGITPEASGQAQTDKVGIAYANLQQVSKRLKLSNKQFKQSLVDLGVMFDYGCYQHLRGDYAVKLLGPNGVDWDDVVTRKDTERDFAITVRAGDQDETQSALANQKRQAAITRIQNDPDLKKNVNPKWLTREILKDGTWDEETVRIALDTSTDATSDVLSRAAQAIEDCLAGRTLRPFRGATDGFVQKIMNYLDDHQYDLSNEEFTKLFAYAKFHIPIAQKNMVRQAVAFKAGMGLPGANPSPAAPQNRPMAGAVPSGAPAPENKPSFSY